MSNHIAYNDWQEMLFGIAKRPINCGFGLEIGNGEVIPEIKVHPRPGKEENLDTLLEEYKNIVNDSLERAIKLGFPSIMVEIEHVAQLTLNPEWGGAVINQSKEILSRFNERYGVKCALRATIADIRKSEKSLRNSKETELVFQAFERCAKEGADILSIESIGGKEVFNYAITRQDIPGVLFAIAVLGSRDMEFLWDNIVQIAERHNCVPGGDTDCAHANTAMMLAGGMIGGDFPHTVAALIRAMGAARSLVAVERGARGPLKDCGYENPIIKAISGVPISMEGKTSACAHMDLMGNLSAAVCDLWSNEAVEYREMFGGSSAAVFTEILGYDVSLMNTALASGTAECLRDLLITSDKYRDPQAFVISPDIAWELGKVIVENRGYYLRAKKAALKAGELIKRELRDGNMKLPPMEIDALNEALAVLEGLPEEEEKFIEWGKAKYRELVEDFLPSSYQL
ncbi:methanol--corrinoid methyltransferase [bacterium]|nr:methanol--corrinoid methyltransferase [bacterium]